MSPPSESAASLPAAAVGGEDTDNLLEQLLDSPMMEDVHLAIEDLLDELGDADILGAGASSVTEFPHIPRVSDIEAPKIPGLYNIEQGDCGTKVSTERGFRPVWKLWRAYCELNGRVAPHMADRGLQLYDPTRLGGYSERNFDRAVVESFFKYLVAQPDTKPDLMTKAKTFINAHLKCEFYTLLRDFSEEHPHIPASVNVGENVSVKNSCQSVIGRKADRSREECLDLYADIDNVISEKQIRSMMEFVFLPKPGGEVEKMNLLYRLEFAASFSLSMQDLRRSEEHRDQLLVQRFTKRVRSIGPVPGTIVSMNLTNKAKHNHVGRLEYTGAAPHSDQLRDSTAWHGLMWLYRFVVKQEGFPNFQDYTELYKVATYRAHESNNTIPENSFSVMWRSFYTDAEVVVGKLTHQPRRQAQQEMDEDGCDTADIARMAGHAVASVKHTRAQMESYLTNVWSPGLVHRAKGNHKELRLHCPAWRSQSSLLVLVLLVPGLVEQQAAIQLEYDACKSMEERKTKRLCLALASINSMLNDIGAAIQMLASRPVDPVTGALLADQPTIRTQFLQFALHDMLNLEAFHSTAYIKLEVEMRRTQDQYFSTEVDLQGPFRNELERIIVQRVNVPIQSMERAHQYQFNQVMQAFAAGTLPGVVHPVSHQQPWHRAPGVAHGTRGTQPITLPAQATTLAKGSAPRKRRSAVTQSQVLQIERAQGVAEGVPRPTLEDASFTTLAQIWRQYQTRWRPLEDRWGSAWRVDIQIPGCSKRNARATWWSSRKPIYLVIEHFMRVENMSEMKALEVANDTFKSVRAGRNGKWATKAVVTAFKRKLAALTSGTRRMGRPPAAATAPANTMFALTFGDSDSADTTRLEQAHYARQTPAQVQEGEDARQHAFALAAQQYQHNLFHSNGYRG
jgi:hypothetical protein